MGVKGSGPVRFDFEGSLVAARTIWALADRLESLRAKRQTSANEALAQWTGSYRNEFASRSSEELSYLSGSITSLREGARGWAAAWKNAMDEENRRRRARKIQQKRDERSWMERNVGDLFLGDDSDKGVAAARQVSTPQPPNFARTAWPQTF